MTEFHTVKEPVDEFSPDNKTSSHSINFHGTETFQKLKKNMCSFVIQIKLNY